MKDWMIVAGIAVLTFFVVRLGWRQRGESAERSAGSREKSTRRRTPTTPEIEALEAIMVQIQEIGREFEARLETKIRFAQRLLQEASDVLHQLDAATGRARRSMDSSHPALPASATNAIPEKAPQFAPTVPLFSSSEGEPRVGDVSVAETTGRGSTESPSANPLLSSPQRSNPQPPKPQPSNPYAADSLSPRRVPPKSTSDESPAQRHSEGWVERPLPGFEPQPAVAESSIGEVPDIDRGIDPSSDEARALREVVDAEELQRQEQEGDDKLSRDQARIRALTAQGIAAAEIANEVGRPVGEIELIQALHRHISDDSNENQKENAKSS